MNGIDVFLEEKAKNLLDSFSFCFNVRITIFSADIQKKLAVGFYQTCSYCELIREKLHYKQRCFHLDRDMCFRSKESPVPLVYDCHAGLVDAAFPIKFNAEIIGYAMIGQFRTRNTIPPSILQAWEKNGFDPAVLQNAFNEQSFFEKASVENMINLFSMLCDYIVSKGYVRTRHLDIAAEVSHWVENHISEPVSFQEVANHLGYSQSAILKSLKKKMNMNFKQLCTARKIEYFENIVTTDPVISIEEAALKAGYRDVSYFSRLYKKFRSITPSAFIKSVCENKKSLH